MWVRARCAHVAVVAALAVVAFAQRPGATTFDTKLDLAENPWAFLDRALSLWNPEANFGELQNQAYGYLFPLGPFFGAADAMGLPPWLAQRLWTALLLAIAYGGVVTLGRALGIGTRPARILAALAYALCPRMVTTLGPISAEALVVAMLPWVVVPLVRWRRWGVRRAAAFSALAIVGMGAANATLVVAVLPLPLLVALTQPHGVRGRLTAWWITCVTLACAWWVVPLLLLDRYSPPFLDYVESAANTTGGVALPDALSGSTHWVARVVIGGEPWWPSGHALATSGWLVIATSVVGVAGLASLLDVRMPQRTAMLASATIGVVVLCLGWNGSFGSPWASQWYALLDGPLAAFRNVHKFDPLVRLPVALGLAHGIGLALTWGRGGRLANAQPKILAGCLAVCSVAALIPALSPGLRPGPGWEETPTWWNEAAAYVAKRDAHSRTLVLPSAGFGTQIWGRTVDEPLQPLASAPWVSRSQVFLGGEGGARLLEAVDGWVESGRGSPALGEVLARAGIRFVIVRGDLDQRLAGTPPVAVVRQALERSGGIVKVAQFGPELRYPDAAGLRVFGWHLDSATPAIEVFEVDAEVAVARIAALGEVTGVTGGPESIPRLVEDGLLDADQPAVLAMDSPSRPGRWLVTDDLARRERSFGRIRENLGPVRSEQEPPRQARAATDLVSPNAEGHLAVARYVGITRVSASSSRGYADSSSPTDTSLGPWSAIDGDPFTAWRSDAGGEPVGEWLRVDFDEPTSMRHLEIRFVASSLVGPRIAAVDVRTEAGVRRSTVRGDGTTERITVPRGLTDFVSVHVARVDGSEDGEIGVLSLELPDVTPQRMVVAPSGRPAEMRAVGAPAGLSFHRLDPTRGACVLVVFSTRCDPNLPARGDEPTNLARGFTTHASAKYRLEGTVLARPGDAVQRLLEPLAGIRTEGSSTLAGDPAVAAARAVDGNGATSWMADPFDPLPTLRLDWSEERIINGLRIMPSTEPVAAGPDLSNPLGWRVVPRARGLVTGFSAGLASVLPDPLVGSAIRAVYPRVEPELRRIAEFVPRGGTAVDLGAWYGPWTQRMTMLADHVVAIEPVPRLASHLRAAFPGVQVVEAAASDHDGTAALYLPQSGPRVGISSLERGRGNSVTVRLTTLDALDLKDVTFIKLDVEGHEMSALRGGATTIQRDSPTLLVELEERIQPIQPVLDLLDQWGYVGSVLPNGNWVPLAHFDLGAHQRATIARVDHSFLRRVVWPRPRYVNSVLFRPA